MTNQSSQSDHRGGGGLSKPIEMSIFQSVPLDETDMLESFDQIYGGAGGGGWKEASTSAPNTMHSNPMAGDSRRLAASNGKSSKGSSASSSEQVQVVVPGPVSVKKRGNSPDRKKTGSSPMRAGGDSSLSEAILVSDRKAIVPDRARTRGDAAANNVRPAPLSTVPSSPTAAGSMKAMELQSDIEAPVPGPPSRKAAAPAEEGKKDASPPKAQKDRFVGANGLQYVLWGHYLAYGSAMMCLLMGEQWC